MRSLPQIRLELERIMDRLPDNNQHISPLQVGDKWLTAKQFLQVLSVDIEDHIPKRDAQGRFVKK